MTTIETLKIKSLEAWKLASDNYGNVDLLRKWEEACERLEAAEESK